jgi:hypothetical protein
MTVETLLQRLDKVKRSTTDPNRWIASCPTRADKHPSMSIRELPDGRVLVHDFGGDSVHEILAAVGLEMSDLFPPRQLFDGRKPERKPFYADDALRCLAFESKLILLAALETIEGKPLNDGDFDRLVLAVERIETALEVTSCTTN